MILDSDGLYSFRYWDLSVWSVTHLIHPGVNLRVEGLL